MCMCRKLLVVDPDQRLSAAQALEHPWLGGAGIKTEFTGKPWVLHYWKDPDDADDACTGWWLSDAVGADDFEATATGAADALEQCTGWNKNGAPVDMSVARISDAAVRVVSGDANLAGVYTHTPAAETSCCPAAYTRTGDAAALPSGTQGVRKEPSARPTPPPCRACCTHGRAVDGFRRCT